MKKTTNFLKPLIFLLILFGIQSCDPPRFCNQPNCLYSDVNVNIPSILSGNVDSVIHIGDSIRLYIKIPDTLITNKYGNIVMKSILGNTFFGINSGGGDTLIGSGEGAWSGIYHTLNHIVIKSGGDVSNGLGSSSWNNEHEYECLYIATEKGKYIIDINGGKINLKDNVDKSWQVNPIFELTNVNKHYNSYLSWMDSSLRQNAYNIISQKKGWYCFEVK